MKAPTVSIKLMIAASRATITGLIRPIAGNSGCVADDCDNADEEDPNGKLGRGSDLDFLHADRRLNETFFETFLINLRGAEVHLAEHRHDESGGHAAEESVSCPRKS